MTEIVQWDKQKLKEFKKVYQEALQRGVDKFTFQGREYVVGYAKYLIEYLEEYFK